MHREQHGSREHGRDDDPAGQVGDLRPTLGGLVVLPPRSTSGAAFSARRLRSEVDRRGLATAGGFDDEGAVDHGVKEMTKGKEATRP